MNRLVVGAAFAGYRIEAVVGRGGMGVIYRATESRPERTVALKVVAPEFAADVEFRARFLRESQIAASIEHPHVVPVLRVGEEDGLLFIAMRFIPGSDLAAVLRAEGRLDPLRAARLVDQVADALDTAHEFGLVHRDVKPGNILVERRRRGEHVYLTDFGLTKSMATGGRLTGTGIAVGTMDYMAPEQWEGGRLDARVDVYSLGCVLFELMTGRVPYPGDAAAQRMYAHISSPPPAVSSIAPGVSPRFDDIVRRALAKEPSDRYPSAGDLGFAALGAAEGRPVSRAERSVASGEAAAEHAASAEPVSSAIRGPILPAARESSPVTTHFDPHKAPIETHVDRTVVREPTMPVRGRSGPSNRSGGGARRRRYVGAAALVLLALGGVAIGVAAMSGSGAKHAASVSNLHVTRSSRLVRTGPKINDPVVGQIGSSVEIVCVTTGDAVSGDSTWDRITHPSGFIPESVIRGNASPAALPQCATPGQTTSRTSSVPATGSGQPFQAQMFSVQLPPRNWVLEHKEQTRRGYVDTRWHLATNPDVVFIVDYTVGFHGDSLGAANSVRKLFNGDRSYTEISFDPISLGYDQGQRWEYVYSAEHSIDTFSTACNTSYAARGGAPQALWPQYAAAFDTAIQSLKPACVQ